MKPLFIPITTLLLTLTTLLHAQDRELLIIGTMHQVPGIVSHSYPPLLKAAIAYAPDAILTEDIMPTDTLSLQLFTPKFLAKAQAENTDPKAIAEATQKPLTEMTQADFEQLSTHYLANRDRANYAYYSYLAEYGLKGSRKPLRNESDDLTHKLAISMGIKQLLPIDDHHEDAEYNQAWLDAVNSGAENGDIQTYFKLTKKNDRRRNLAALLGRLGKFTNRLDVLTHYYQINSVRYVEHPNEHTELAKSLWDARNERMAEHILYQLNTTGSTHAILIVGSGHAISLRNALATLDPTLKVTLLAD